MSQAYAEATAAMRQAEADRRASTAAERSRRHLVRLLDWAITVCEEANLGRRAREDPALRVLGTLIEQLQAIAGVEPCQVTSPVEALEQLFRLQELYLLTDAAGDRGLAQSMEEARASGLQELEVQTERIAGAAGVSLQVLRGPSRSRELVALRRLVARHLQSHGCSLPAIGRLLHRDHSSVVNLLRPAPGGPR